MYYLIMSVLEDEETQKKGISAIVYSVAGEFVDGKTDLRTVSAGPWVQRSLPFRLCAMHQCFDNLAVRVIINFSMRFLREKDRARVKLHYGRWSTQDEILFNTHRPNLSHFLLSFLDRS